MRKTFTENLTKKVYKDKVCIDWAISEGNDIDFVYDNIKGYFTILEYNKSINKIKIVCSIYNIEGWIKPYDFSVCKIKTYIQTIINVSKVFKYLKIAKKLGRNLTEKERNYFQLNTKSMNSGFKYLGYDNIIDFQNKNNLIYKSKLKYNYMDIYVNYKEFFDKYDRFPVNSDYKSDSNIISKFQVYKTLEDKKMSMDDLFKEISKTNYNREEYEYNKTIKKFKEVCIKENKVISINLLQEKIGHDMRWISNRNMSIKSYYDFYHSFGFKNECDLDKNEIIERIYKMQSKLDRPLMYNDFRDSDSFDEVGIFSVKRIWCTMNKMKEDLGLEIIQEDMIGKEKSKEELLDDMQNLIDELGRLPLSKEINECTYTNGCGSYNKYFGGINDVFIQLGYVPNKKSISLHMTNEDIITIYKDFIEDCGVVPSHAYACDTYILPAPITVMRRFECSWNEFITMLGYTPNDCRYNKTEASDGTLCNSVGEAITQNYLLKLPINDLAKETMYRDILCNEALQQEAGFKRLDWTFQYNGQVYYIELFGMMGFQEYDKKHDEKISLITRDNKLNNFIAIYPKDLNKLNLIFSFIK